MNNLINKKSLEVQTLENIKNSKSKNTNRAYKADFDHFKDFCKNNNLSHNKPEPKTISIYLTDLSIKGFKYSTIRRRLVSISLANKLSGNYIDTKHPVIDENLKSIRRKIGSFQRGKSPISLNELNEIVELIDNEQKKISLRAIRNKAMILIGFSGGFRRSEIVSLDFEDITFVYEGIKIFLKKSKTDQYGEGFLKGIPYFDEEKLCPVKALKKWLEVSKISKGPIFRKISKSQNILNNRLTDQSVALIIKKYINYSGLNYHNFSGHSLRSGFATTAASLGADERSIMNMTGHKSTNMVRRYIRETNLFSNNALNKIAKI